MSRDRSLVFDKKLFTNIYWEIQDFFGDNGKRFLWVYGGSGSSKTYSTVQAVIVNMLNSKDFNCLVLRKYASDLRDTIYREFR